MIRRVYVEKRKGFDVKAQNLQHEIKEVLGADVGLRFFVRYDFEGKNEDFEKALNVVFSEPPADIYYLDAINAEGRVLCVEFLPGQYDQRADSAAQCVSMLTGGERPFIKCASVYVIEGAEDAEFEKIKRYFINPVETRECGDDLHCELKAEYPEPPPEETVDGFVFLREPHGGHVDVDGAGDLVFLKRDPVDGRRHGQVVAVLLYAPQVAAQRLARVGNGLDLGNCAGYAAGQIRKGDGDLLFFKGKYGRV